VTDSSISTDLREVLTDAIRFWEPRRVVYNAALAVVSAVLLAPHTETLLQGPAARVLTGFVALLTLAVLANLAYCAAYIPDIVAQLSSYRNAWSGNRWILFMFGTAFACAVAAIVLMFPAHPGF
jgi:hypothetical protein